METFRKNGEGVRTPVRVVEDGGGVHCVRTDPTSSWKAKRVRVEPESPPGSLRHET